jgi:AmiR/NasT family two-component response regulator
MPHHFESGDGTSVDGHQLPKEVVAEITQLALYADAQQKRVGELEARVTQLQAALDSRVVIERASGVLAERFHLSLEDAYELLRSAARDSRQKVRAIAYEVITSRGWTPDEIVDARRRRDG